MLATLALLLCPLAVAQNPAPRALLVRDGEPAPSTGRVADDPAAVLDALLAGPTITDRAAGLTTAIPPGTRLVAVAVRGDEIVADLSADFAIAGELAFEQVVKSLGTLGRFHRFTIRVPDAAGEWRPFGERPAVAELPRAPAGGAGLAAVPGVLSGRTIACSPGHGWYWHTTLGWTTQRPTIDGLTEDFHTNEMMIEWVIPYLENAGATIVHCRDVGRITSELVLQNDSGAPVYAESGGWSTGSGSGFGGGTYRFATSVATETARATWSAAVPADGLYPVWVAFKAGTNRSTDVHFVVEHTGGVADVAVDQSADDLRWVHLGVFHFAPAQPARVHLTNRSADTGKVVIADAVRIGAGMGTLVRGGAPSGKPRWQECSRYWAQFNGAPASVWDSIAGGEDNDDDVTCRPRYAEWRGADAFVSLHTNAGGGTGTDTFIYNGTFTPGSDVLQQRIHAQVIGDIRALYDATWVDRGMQQANFGEVRLLSTMPGLLIELAFHDDPARKDHRYLHDPLFRQIACRAIARGVIRYFSPTAPFPPEPPVNARVTQDGAGGLRVAWDPVAGATGYVVEQSPDGMGFDAGAATAATSLSTGPLPHGTWRAFRVRATNASGRSFATEVLVGRTGPTGRADLLLVNGFDRFDRFVKEPDNRRNQLAFHADAIARIADFAVAFDSAGNEAVIAGRTALADYRAVDWALGEESTVNETFATSEQALLGAFLATGGRAFVNGAEIGWDLDFNGSAADRAFYRGPLAAQYVSDDAGTHAFAPAAGSIFAGLAGGTFDDGTGGTYDVDYPDAMQPSGAGARASLVYPGVALTAAVEQDTGTARVLNWGFPFETIVNPSLRAQYMDRAVDFLTAPRALQGPRTVTLGGQARFDVRLPARTGQLYLLAAAGGNQPGLPLGGGRTLALQLDPLFFLSLGSPSGVFAGFVGLLDANGAAAAFVNMPNLPELRGLQIYVSGLVLDAALVNVDDVLPWCRLTVP